VMCNWSMDHIINRGEKIGSLTHAVSSDTRISLSVVALFFFSITLNAQQFHKHLSPAEKEHILDGRFMEVTRTEAMPASVKGALPRLRVNPRLHWPIPGRNIRSRMSWLTEVCPADASSSREYGAANGLFIMSEAA
jgi:hypothetical protein